MAALTDSTEEDQLRCLEGGRVPRGRGWGEGEKGGWGGVRKRRTGRGRAGVCVSPAGHEPQGPRELGGCSECCHLSCPVSLVDGHHIRHLHALVRGLGSRVKGLGLRILGLESRVWGQGFGVKDVWARE